MTIMRDVKSSNLKRLGYDEATRTLHVEFITGASGFYNDVPPEIDAELRRREAEGDSIGKFFAWTIRGAYAWTATPKREHEAANLLAAG